MNIFRQVFQKVCHHEWIKTYEEHIVFEDGAGAHTCMSPKWTCKKCGKYSWKNPNPQIL